MSNLCLIAASLVAHGQVPGWQLEVPQVSSRIRRIPLGTTTALSRKCRSTSPVTLARAAVGIAETYDRPQFSGQANGRSHNLYQFQLAAPARSSLKPTSGAQLYRQRMMALKAGKIYTRLPADSFVEEWYEAQQQPTHSQWVDLLGREATMMASGQGSDKLTVLLGDSHALWFPQERLAKDRFWLNQGISGETSADVLKRLSLFAKTRPDTIHIMVGINDLRQGKSDPEILANLRAIMRQLRQMHPDAKVYIHSILPTRLAAIPSNRIRWLNLNIASMTKEEGVSFLNLQPAFADADGNLRRALTTDGVHLSSQGYEVWQSAVAPIL